MRKELGNSYLAEVSENGKFLGKNKVEAHGGNNNTVSNADSVENVSVATCADLHIGTFISSIDKLTFNTPSSSREEVLGAIERMYKGSHYHINQSMQDLWFSTLNLNIKKN